MEMIKRDIKKYHLDFKRTFPYFIDHIQCGKTLSRKVIENIDFRIGTFFTVLPLTAVFDQLYEFSNGGIIPSIPYDDQRDQPSYSYPRQVITMDHELSTFIFSYLKKDARRYAIIENYMLEPESPHVNIKNVEMIPYHKEAYYFLNKMNSKKEIYETIRKSSEVWHFLCILTIVERDAVFSLTQQQMNEIIENVQFVIASAYDGESYVLWEKEKPK